MTFKQERRFSWDNEGIKDLQVSLGDNADIAHEVLYEDDATKIRERPIYLGRAIPLHRFMVIFIFVFILLGILISRAFWMQGLADEKYKLMAENNRLRKEILMPSRGIITDRNDYPLAENESTFDVTAIPVDLPADEDSRREVFGRISRIAGSSIAEIEQVAASSTIWDQSVILIRDVPYEQAVAIKIALADQPGIQVAHGQKRRYRQTPQIFSLSHVLGYAGKISSSEHETLKNKGYSRNDMIGKTGVEAWYEERLRGKTGERLIEVDAFGSPKRVVHEDLPIQGETIKLTIDTKFQLRVEQALKNALEKEGIKHGAAVALDPRDGSILAIVSWPAYDNNIFSGKVSSTLYASLVEDENMPFLARAWAGVYPSGSTIKPIYAAGALADGIITQNTSFLSTGGLRIGAYFFPDWQAGGHGLTNVRRAIAWSVNTFFYYIGGGYEGFEGMGVEGLTKWLKVFGFGQKTGLDLVGEVDGFVPSKEWKVQKKNERWYVGDTYNLSIGQGDLLVTPLQIAVATAEIANGGKRITPHVLFDEGIESGEQIVKEDAVDVVRAGMRDTVVYGSGRALANMEIEVAGKTGTAQWRSDKPNHAWFTAFAPYDNPRIAIAVLLEQGEEGSRTAVPVGREILQAWMELFDGDQ
ncbi:MAG: penicillin-binding protein 2 [Patescibacteria group bacterium]